jgi:2,4-dienoyl-CoA reductase-like NADH-dependent reductase (Old Yellow Enzyme family)/thioredoxin reductase
MFDHLFSPLDIGPVKIKNRVQVTPHGQEYFENGLPSDTLYAYYVERAKGGAGLLEISQIYVKPPTGIISPDWQTESAKRFPMLNSPEIIPGLRRISEAVHSFDSKIFMQISAWPYLYGLVSSVPFQTGMQLKELTSSTVEEIVQAFVQAGDYVRESDFDGVDLHASHGSLIEFFCSPVMNRRTDRYGGSLENNLRFLLEIVEGTRRALGSSKALGVRLCADEKIDGGITPEYAAMMMELLDGRIDFANVDRGSVYYNFNTTDQGALQTQPFYSETAYGTYMTEKLKQKTKNTKIGIAGRIMDPMAADLIIEKKQADYVGMTRALIADPELPAKAMAGQIEDIRPCIGTLQDCIGRIVRGHPMRCTVNPAVGREKERGRDTINGAQQSKRVLVIGAGPAGLEAARMASERGHSVVVYEKSGEIGGQVNLAKMLPARSEIAAIIGWYENQLRKNKVQIEFHKEVPSDQEVIQFLVDEEKPDVVIIATGSVPIENGIQMITFREIPGWNEPTVHTIDEVLSSHVAIDGGKAVVFDCTTYIEGPGIAEWLVRHNAKETILVTPHSQMSPELFFYNQAMHVYRRMVNAKVKVITHSWVKRIKENKAVIYNIPLGSEDMIEADNFVLNTGRKQSGGGLYKLFEGKVREVYEIGDCDVAGGRIGRAIETGFKIGSAI